MKKVNMKDHETWPDAFKAAVEEQGLADELFNSDCELATVNARMEMVRCATSKSSRVLPGSGFGMGMEPTGKWFFEFEVHHREHAYSCLFVTDLVTFEEAKMIVRSIEDARGIS